MNDEAKRYLDLIRDEPYKIGHWLGFEGLSVMHNDWIKSMLFGKEDETLLAHRGSYKTTCISIAITLLMILFPNLSIIFMRKTDDDVKEIIRQIQSALNSEVIKHIVFKIYNIELELVEDSAFKTTTNLKVKSTGHSQLLALGIGSSLTGKHADIIITDDMVTLKDRVSKADRDKAKLVYMELQNVRNEGSRIFNIGTPWHKEDAISLMTNIRYYDCYNTGMMTKEQIKAKRDSMDPSLFAANYELKHIASGEALFDNPKYTDNEMLIHNGISHVDAAYGGNDSTAYTIIKRSGNEFVGLGKQWNKHVNDCINEIVALQQQYRVGSISCETNSDKGYLAERLESHGLYVDDYHESMNKFIKISTYLRKNWRNIIWLEGTDPEYMSEILDYTENAEHDDAPDSAASLLRKLESVAGFDFDWY